LRPWTIVDPTPYFSAGRWIFGNGNGNGKHTTNIDIYMKVMVMIMKMKMMTTMVEIMVMVIRFGGIGASRSERGWSGPHAPNQPPPPGAARAAQPGITRRGCSGPARAYQLITTK